MRWQAAAADAPERPCNTAPAASAVAAGAGHACRLRRRLRLVRGAGAPPLSPTRRRRHSAAPDLYARRVERFANLFGERHFPLYAPMIEFWTDSDDEPPWSWLRRGIPFELMGFGYDGLHEMWNGYREGLSAMALLVKPPDVYYDGPDGLRVAWLESAAERIPQETLQRVPEGGIPLEDLTEALKGHEVRGCGAKPAPGSSPRPATGLPRPLLRRREL